MPSGGRRSRRHAAPGRRRDEPGLRRAARRGPPLSRDRQQHRPADVGRDGLRPGHRNSAHGGDSRHDRAAARARICDDGSADRDRCRRRLRHWSGLRAPARAKTGYRVDRARDGPSRSSMRPSGRSARGRRHRKRLRGRRPGLGSAGRAQCPGRAGRGRPADRLRGRPVPVAGGRDLAQGLEVRAGRRI